jgi:hypothetical protein
VFLLVEFCVEHRPMSDVVCICYGIHILTEVELNYETPPVSNTSQTLDESNQIRNGGGGVVCVKWGNRARRSTGRGAKLIKLIQQFKTLSFLGGGRGRISLACPRRRKP